MVNGQQSTAKPLRDQRDAVIVEQARSKQPDDEYIHRINVDRNSTILAQILLNYAANNEPTCTCIDEQENGMDTLLLMQRNLNSSTIM